MNGQLADPVRRLAHTRQSISDGVRLVEAIRGTSGAVVTVVDDVNVSTAICSITGSALVDLRANLEAAATSGHRVSARFSQGGGDLQVTWRSDGPPYVESEGDVGELVGQRRVEDLDRAVGRGDAIAALQLLGDDSFDVEVVIRPPENGTSWVPTTSLLNERLRDGRWASTLVQMTPPDGSSQIAVVSIQDASDSLLLTPGLVLAGPDAELPSGLPPRQPERAEAYRTRASRGPRPNMFLPAELALSAVPTGDFGQLIDPLASCARAAAWYWLADSATFGPESVTVRFDGVSSLDFELQPYGTGLPTAEVALAEWATDTGEPSRADAVQQAVTFAVRSVSDLDGAAGPVLRTARSLYELASRGLISEALSARRAARQSATTAAGSAAASARDVATKSVERALTLVIAASVALFANGQKLIDNATSSIILIVLAAVAVAALVVALAVDIRSAQGVLNAFEVDVELGRESLSEDDISAAKNLKALGSARADLRRARTTASIIYGAVVIAVSVGGCILIGSHGSGAITTQTSTATPMPTAGGAD